MNKVIDNIICSSIHNINLIKNTENKYKFRLLKELTLLANISDLHISIISDKIINVNILLNDTSISCFNIVIDEHYPFSCPQVIFFLNNETDKSSKNYIKLLGFLIFTILK